MIVKSLAPNTHFLVSQNPADGLFQEGRRLWEQQRFSDAAKSWGQAAMSKHAASHAYLSEMLIDGKQDVPKDEKRAFELAAAGAVMGCAHSKGVLGRCYVHGAGVVKDLGKGLAFGRQSAAVGSCFGQFVVGKCYQEGWGVAQDYTEAARWWRLAAAQGHARAQSSLGAILMLKLLLSAEELRQDRIVAGNYAEAERWFRLSAAQGCAAAQNNLGVMFLNGRGVAKDTAEAIRWFRLAAAQGEELAIENLMMLGVFFGGGGER